MSVSGFLRARPLVAATTMTALGFGAGWYFRGPDTAAPPPPGPVKASLAGGDREKHGALTRAAEDADLILLRDGAWADAAGKIEPERAPAFFQEVNRRLAAKQRVLLRTEAAIPLQIVLTAFQNLAPGLRFEPVTVPPLLAQARRQVPPPGSKEGAAEKSLVDRLRQRKDKAARAAALQEVSTLLFSRNPAEQLAGLAGIGAATAIPGDHSAWLPRVRELIASTDDKVRGLAINSLISAKGGPEDAAMIAAFAADGSTDIRKAVAGALPWLDPTLQRPETAAAINRLINDPDPEIQKNVIQLSWGKPVPPEAEAALVDRFQTAPGPGGGDHDIFYYFLTTRPEFSAPVAQTLTKLLQGDFPDSRILWGLGNGTVVPEARDTVVSAVISYVDDSTDDYGRRQGLAALARQHTEAARAALQRIADDPEEEAHIREAASKRLW